VEGKIMATEKHDKPDSVNLGTGKEITITELTNPLGYQIGFKGLTLWDGEKPDGQPIRFIVTIRAKTGFDFEAKIDFETLLNEPSIGVKAESIIKQFEKGM
jgi:hypothetical protein